jgi:hypothetical protein
MEERDLAFGRRLLDELGFHVGVTERYADMLHVFEHVSGSRIPEGRVDHENASPSGHGDLTPELRARIAAANSLDRALYEHACSRVEAQVAAMGPAPAYELRGPDRATAGDPDTSAP